jgi:hypothetical protein
MKVKLHRDRVPLKTDGHPCWRIEKALIDAGIDYEVVHEPALPRSRRKKVIAATGQALLPAIGFPDGRWLHEESAAGLDLEPLKEELGLLHDLVA